MEENPTSLRQKMKELHNAETNNNALQLTAQPNEKLAEDNAGFEGSPLESPDLFASDFSQILDSNFGAYSAFNNTNAISVPNAKAVQDTPVSVAKLHAYS